MHRLRHPIRSITEPYGKAGLLVAILALVLATTGAAFAAVGLNPKQKKQVIVIAKKFAGKPGATGPAGPAGTNGTNGTNGKDGTNGAPGANVAVGTATSTPTGECPTVGGATVEVEGDATTKKHVCNGSPWTAGGTLPKGATETGEWSIATTQAASPDLGFGEANQLMPVSFEIPLGGTLNAAHTVFVPVHDTTTEHCSKAPLSGTAEDPKADSGYLCVYAIQVENMVPSPATAGAFGSAFFRFGSEATGAGKVGTSLVLKVPAAGATVGVFSWAVTG